MLASPLVGETWRYVDCGAVDAFQNNAQMAVLARSVSEAGVAALQTSVWGATHLNVGWFDDVDSTLDLAACRRLDVQVIRRPFAGGGTAFYDAGCAVMWGLLYPKGAGHDDLDAEIARMQPIVSDTLDRLGLTEVRFEGSADLRWHGRKLGGVSAGDMGRVISVGGFLNIKAPDLDRYLQVVRVPDEKFKDKLVSDMREYVCTAEEVTGKAVGYRNFRDALLSAVTDAGLELDIAPLTDVEEAARAKISQRIASDDAVQRISSDRFRATYERTGQQVGFGNYKGRKLCRAGVALDERGTAVAVMMAGDMHVAPPDTLDRVATALVGVDTDDAHDVRGRVASIWDGPDVHQADATMGVTTDDLCAAIATAVDDARPSSTEAR
jgi:lipoate-protein ligase A